MTDSGVLPSTPQRWDLDVDEHGRHILSTSMVLLPATFDLIQEAISAACPDDVVVLHADTPDFPEAPEGASWVLMKDGHLAEWRAMLEFGETGIESQPFRELMWKWLEGFGELNPEPVVIEPGMWVEWSGAVAKVASIEGEGVNMVGNHLAFLIAHISKVQVAERPAWADDYPGLFGTGETNE